MLSILVSFPALAQSNTSEQISALVTQCSEGTMLSDCPNTCKAACTDADFNMANSAGCAAAFAAGPEADKAICNPGAKVTLTSFSKCVADARSIARQPNAIISQRQEWLDIYNEFFSDQPSCAASDEAVSAMYRCLQGETELVTIDYEELGSIGSVQQKPTTSEMRELSCRHSEEELVKMVDGAGKLQSRAGTLDDHLGEVSICRKQYAEWLDERGSFCEKGSIPNCETVINVFQQDLRDSLEGAEEQSQQIGTMLTQLTEDIDLVFTLGMIRPSKCE